MTLASPLHFTPLADTSLLIELDDESTARLDVVASVWALTRAIDANLPVGVDDVIPAYRTILISFDPTLTDPQTLESQVNAISKTASESAPDQAGEVTIPVVYGDEFGPDLVEVAERAGLRADQVIELHAGATYHVACGGFAPGWDYLMGLPEILATPRRTNPRTRIPPGSVAIGGAQTGVYPLETPGGWNLIGRTPLKMFDPLREDPFLLHPGDTVRFSVISKEDYSTLERDSSTQSGGVPPQFLSTNREFDSERNAYPSVNVVQPGLLTTIQDLGRSGMGRFGVAPGGALDRQALILGNRLLDNDPGEAAVEMTLLGPTLEFSGEAVVALTGADLGALINGAPCPIWQPFAVRPGDVLSYRFDGAQAAGARQYLCVAGGIDIPQVLGSRSTDLVGRFGGLDGRALKAGDYIHLRSANYDHRLLGRHLSESPERWDENAPFRVTLGPQSDRFTGEGVASFLNEPYEVTSQSNRTGVRLSGPPIGLKTNADLLSEGIAHGAIQVPGDGQPIVLLAARQTVGGYVKIATVIGADLDRFSQLRPGATVDFTEVTPGEARRATIGARARVNEISVIEAARVHNGWKSNDESPTHESALVDMNDYWDPAGVVRVIEAATAAGVTSLRISVASAGLDLEFTRDTAGGDSALLPKQHKSMSSDDSPGEHVVVAPVLGVLYRKSAPDQPLLATEGDEVVEGQTIALLEVMKTFHEVQSPVRGMLSTFLVDDGQFVEYGQAIAKIAISSP